MIFCALVMSLVLPFTISFEPPYSDTFIYQICLLGIDLIFFIDMIFSFRSATFDIMTGEDVNEPSQVAR